MTRDQLPNCSKCDVRQAHGYLSVHTSAGSHVGIWATCYHCAELDGVELDSAGYLVAFLQPRKIAQTR